MPCERPTIRYRSYGPGRPLCLDRYETWLGPSELAELGRLRNEDRRQSWIFARFVCKQLIIDWLGGPAPGFHELEITSRDAAGRAVRPRVSINGNTLDCSLSLSHTERGVLAAFSQGSERRIGVDLTPAKRLPDGFLSIWFTDAEQAWLEHADSVAAAVCWAIKEAVYKACNTGERFAPRRIEVFPDSFGGYTCRYGGTGLGRNADLQTWHLDGHVAAMVTLVGGSHQLARSVRDARLGRKRAHAAV